MGHLDRLGLDPSYYQNIVGEEAFNLGFSSMYYNPSIKMVLIGINVNTNMYIFARLRMYKITRFLRLNDALIGMNHLRL